MNRPGPWSGALDGVAARASRRTWHAAYEDFALDTFRAAGVPAGTDPAEAWRRATSLALPLELHPVLADSRHARGDYLDAVRQVAQHLAAHGADAVSGTETAARVRRELGLPTRLPGGAPASAQASAAAELERLTLREEPGSAPDIDALTRRVLHLPADAEVSAEHRAQLLVTVENAMAAGWSSSVDALGAYHLAAGGTLDHGRHITAANGAHQGLNLTGRPVGPVDTTQVWQRRENQFQGPLEPLWDADTGAYVVVADGGHDHVVLPRGQGHIRVPWQEFVELVARDPGIAGLPAGTPVVLVLAHGGDQGLALPRTLAFRTGRDGVWAHSGQVGLVTDPTTGVERIVVENRRSEGRPLGGWFSSDADDLGPDGVAGTGFVTTLDGTILPDAAIKTRTIGDDGRSFGRVTMSDPDLVTNEPMLEALGGDHRVRPVRPGVGGGDRRTGRAPGERAAGLPLRAARHAAARGDGGGRRPPTGPGGRRGERPVHPPPAEHEEARPERRHRPRVVLGRRHGRGPALPVGRGRAPVRVRRPRRHLVRAGRGQRQRRRGHGGGPRPCADARGDPEGRCAGEPLGRAGRAPPAAPRTGPGRAGPPGPGGGAAHRERAGPRRRPRHHAAPREGPAAVVRRRRGLGRAVRGAAERHRGPGEHAPGRSASARHGAVHAPPSAPGHARAPPAHQQRPAVPGRCPAGPDRRRRKEGRGRRRAADAAPVHAPAVAGLGAEAPGRAGSGRALRRRAAAAGRGRGVACGREPAGVGGAVRAAEYLRSVTDPVALAKKALHLPASADLTADGAGDRLLWLMAGATVSGFDPADPADLAAWDLVRHGALDDSTRLTADGVPTGRDWTRRPVIGDIATDGYLVSPDGGLDGATPYPAPWPDAPPGSAAKAYVVHADSTNGHVSMPWPDGSSRWVPGSEIAALLRHEPGPPADRPARPAARGRRPHQPRRARAAHRRACGDGPDDAVVRAAQRPRPAPVERSERDRPDGGDDHAAGPLADPAARRPARRLRPAGPPPHVHRAGARDRVLHGGGDHVHRRRARRALAVRTRPRPAPRRARRPRPPRADPRHRPGRTAPEHRRGPRRRPGGRGRSSGC
ncbi:lonely Cys domain-containing protein [Streptomyces sp. S1A(2023)]